MSQPHKPIAIYNYKGGVGKSTIAANLADAAAQKIDACVVDCDPQCTTTFYMLGIQKAMELMGKKTSVKWLFDWIKSNDHLPRMPDMLPVQADSWKAKIITGDLSLTDLELELVVHGEGAAKRIWQSLWRINDDSLTFWPILDCSPSYSYFTIAATCTANGGIFIPVTTEEDSLYGINLAARALHRVRFASKELNISPGKIRGIICNRVTSGKKAALRKGLDFVISRAQGAFPESFAENFRILDTMLPEDPSLPTIRGSRRSIVSAAPSGASGKAYFELFHEVSELCKKNVHANPAT